MITRRNTAYLKGTGVAGDFLTGATRGYDKNEDWAIVFRYVPNVQGAGDILVSDCVNDATKRGWYIQHVVGAAPNDGLRFVYSNDVATDRRIIIGRILEPKTIYHVVFRWSSAGVGTFFVDGKPSVKTEIFGSAPAGTVISGAQVFRVLSEGATTGADVGIDDLMCIFGVVTDAEVEALYNGGTWKDPATIAFAGAVIEDHWEFENSGAWPTCTSRQGTALTAVGTWSGGGNNGISKLNVPYLVGRIYGFAGNIAELEEAGSDGYDVTDEGATYLLAPTTPASTGFNHRQLKVPLYTTAPRFRMRLLYTQVTAGVTGIGIWTDEAQDKVSVGGLINTSNGTLTLHVGLRADIDTIGARATSGAAAFASANGDVIELILEQNRHVLYLSVRNVTTQAKEVRISYALARANTGGSWSHPASNGKPAIFLRTGTSRISKAGTPFVFENKGLKHPRYLIVGASIDVGVAASTFDNTYLAIARAAQAAARTDWGGSLEGSAGGGDRTTSVMLRDGVGEEIDLIAPECVIMHIGHNDLSGGRLLADVQADYTTIHNNLLALDSVRKIKHMKLTPLDAYNVTAFHPHQASFGEPVIDTYTPLKGAGTDLGATYDAGDGSHLNDAGGVAVAGALASTLDDNIRSTAAFARANTVITMAGMG